MRTTLNKQVVDLNLIRSNILILVVVLAAAAVVGGAIILAAVEWRIIDG
jgi:hypothetical protein